MSFRECRVTPRKERMSPQSAGARGGLISAAHRFCDQVQVMVLARVCEALSLPQETGIKCLINPHVAVFAPSPEDSAAP